MRTTWHTGQVLGLLAALLACAEHGADAPADDREPASSPALPLLEEIPEDLPPGQVREVAMDGRLWIHPLGARAVFRSARGQDLRVNGLEPRLVALHGRALRVEGTIWKCEGRWSITPLRYVSIGETELPTRPDGGVPAYPQVRTRAQLVGATAPWVLVTGAVVGHWQEDRFADQRGETELELPALWEDGATVRLQDGFEMRLHDLHLRPLRRVVVGDSVTVVLRGGERASGGAWPIAVCAGGSLWGGASQLEYSKPTILVRPERCGERAGSVPVSSGQALLRGEAPPEPTRRDMPPVDCQYASKIGRRWCSKWR